MADEAQARIEARLAAVNRLSEQLKLEDVKERDLVHRLAELAVRLPCPACLSAGASATALRALPLTGCSCARKQGLPKWDWWRILGDPRTLFLPAEVQARCKSKNKFHNVKNYLGGGADGVVLVRAFGPRACPSCLQRKVLSLHARAARPWRS